MTPRGPGWRQGSDLCGQVSETQNLDAQGRQLVPMSAVEAAWMAAGKPRTHAHFEKEKRVSGK